jgi:peptide/nickel transport system substrate-binding protein
MNPEAGFSGHSYFAKNVKEVRKVDEYTIEVELNEVYTPALYRIATVVIVPEHILSGVEPSELRTNEFNKKPLGTGPWIVEEWVDDEYIQYSRFDDYWRGTPKLDSIKFRVISDKATGIAALEAGEIQCIFQQIYRTALIQNFETLEDNPDVKVIEYPPTGTNYVIINLEHPKLNNKYVRQAMAQAIDYDGIVNGVYNGHASRTTQWYSPLMEGYYNPDLGWEYDIEAAKAKMEMAGYKYSWIEEPEPTDVTPTTNYTLIAGSLIVGLIVGFAVDRFVVGSS